ncbi:MAG: ABC transporter substrate-binding protein [Gammaproteobacteria bacterium]|nr:ABC transporter substrate-binding protein [Gammaproteobacteria bacterium]
MSCLTGNIRLIVKILVPVLLLMAGHAGSRVFAQENNIDHPALKLVRDTTVLIKKRIKEDDAAIKSNQEHLYDLVNEIVLPHFDFEKMSSWVLGKNWRDASNDQKKRFTDEFSRLLVRTYSRAIYDNIDQQINFLPIRGTPEDDKVTIRTEIPQQAGFPIPIDYKMYLKDSEWKVYDVVIDAISLVANYRTSFNQEIKKSGIDSLIASLADRNKKPVDDKATQSN